MIRQSHSDSPAAKPSAPEARPLAAGAPSWAIGTFRGYDAGERTTVEVTALPTPIAVELKVVLWLGAR